MTARATARDAGARAQRGCNKNRLAPHLAVDMLLRTLLPALILPLAAVGCQHLLDVLADQDPAGDMPALDAGARLPMLAHSGGSLYRVHPESCRVELVGAFGRSDVSDLAVMPGGSGAFGITLGGQLLAVDIKTGATRELGALGRSCTALAFVSEGELLVGCDRELMRVDMQTFALSRVVELPRSMSGDLVRWRAGVMLATVVGNLGDDLVSVDLSTRTVAPVATLPVDAVWGLAFAGPRLFGFARSGRVLEVDLAARETREVFTTTVSFWGASGQGADLFAWRPTSFAPALAPCPAAPPPTVPPEP